MIYLIYFVTLFLCFFILFTLSRNDFVLIRKNTSSTAIFDAIGVGLVFAFFLGRILYIIDSGKIGLLYPLTFLHIIKYPGVSILGIFLGLFLALIAFRKKKVILRMGDILSLAFSPILFISVLSFPTPASYLPIKIGMSVGVFIFWIVLIWFHKKYALHDGSITLAVLLLLSLDTVITQLHAAHRTFIFLFSFSQWIGIIIAFVSVIFIIINEKANRKK